MSLNLALRLTGPHPLWESDTVGSLNADMSSDGEWRKRRKNLLEICTPPLEQKLAHTLGTALSSTASNEKNQSSKPNKICGNHYVTGLQGMLFLILFFY
jgi:hypothetical protein